MPDSTEAPKPDPSPGPFGEPLLYEFEAKGIRRTALSPDERRERILCNVLLIVVGELFAIGFMIVTFLIVDGFVALVNRDLAALPFSSWHAFYEAVRPWGRGWGLLVLGPLAALRWGNSILDQADNRSRIFSRN